MKKTFVITLILLSSCTLRNPDPLRHREVFPLQNQKPSLDQHIRTIIDEYTTQSRADNHASSQTAPKMKYRFGDVVLAVPDNIRVYGRQIERKYGNISEILPQGWRFLYRSDQGRFVYSFGNEQYPTIDPTTTGADK
ncbi:MAG: hypothetical protein ACE5FU_01290 [Nitrospinota bacterium]